MTTDILKERQAWTLAQKVDHALATIDVFISRMGGIDKVYCSFSGGKDSTVYYTFAEFFILTFWRCFALPATNTPK